MKTQKVVLLCGLILAIGLDAGCAQSNSLASTPSPESSNPTASSTMSIQTATLAPTFPPLPTITPTIFPTLSVEEARTRLLDLLANNGNCQLPCLWGITPGKNLFQEARAILMPLSGLAYSVHLSSPNVGEISPVYADGDFVLYTRVAFLYHDNGTISRIAFNVEAHKPLPQGGYEDVFDSKSFGEKISAYALPHVLTEQGIPSSVMISTFGGPLTRGGTGGFDILLLYPQQGILVNYTTQIHLIGTNVLGCPSNAHVEMELFPPGQPDSFFEGLKQTDWAVKMNGYQPLEEVTSMSVEEFYKAFRDPTNKCIETPASLWPVPEP